MRALVPVLTLLFIYFSTTEPSSRQRKCRAIKGRYYHHLAAGQTFKCRQCDTCPFGQEWDRNATIRTSDLFGDLECLPCVPCRDGYFKDRNTLSYCSPCLLKCVVLNRYEDAQCGHIQRGHCGSCLPGFEDTMRDTNFPCMLIEHGKAEEKSVEAETDRSRELHDQPSKEIRDIRDQTSKHDEDGSIIAKHKNIAILSGCAIIIAICLAILVVVIRIFRSRDGQSRPSYPAMDPVVFNSGEKLLPGEDTVEIDGVPEGCVVRGELQSYVSSTEYTTIQSVLERILEHEDKLLTKDDNILSVVSMSVNVDQASHLFHILEVPNQAVTAEKHRYQQGFILFKDYVLNCLILWVNRAERQATLHNLCGFLFQAQCGLALSNVLSDLAIKEQNGATF